MHGDHAVIETVAAIVLTVGGAAILFRAWLARGRGDQTPGGARLPDEATGTGRRSVDVVVVVLSAAAAAIHLAAGPGHVEALGDLGLGFYWAALVQGAFAVAWVTAGRSHRLAGFGIAVNAALIAAWGWSRTVGLGLPGGPEGIGVADGVTIVLEIALIGILASALSARRPLVKFLVRIPAASAAIAIGGIALLATTIALVDIGGGHDDAHERTATNAAHAAVP